MKRYVAASLLLICTGAHADTIGLGTGSAGAFSAAALNTVVNKYTTVAGSGASQLGTTVPVNDTSICTDGGVILLWQSEGYTPAAKNVGTVTLQNTDSFGTYEIVRLLPGGSGCTTTPGAGNLTTKTPLTRAYAAGTTQVVFVPEFTTVTIPVNKSITATPWSPGFGYGGIVAFLATGAVTVNGAIDVSGAGYLGGSVSTQCTAQSTAEGQPAANNGDDLTRVGTVFNVAGWENQDNGGGGGLCETSGGGGGGGAGAGANGGNGNGVSSPGQGGANVAFGSGVGDTSTMVLGGGGGGGAGAQNPVAATPGGAGGGVVWFRAASLGFSSTLAGSVNASGQSAASSTLGDGAGGGGSGGTILIRLSGANSLTCGSLLAAGGDGGLSTGTGGGGGGGGGRLFLQASTTPVCSALLQVPGGAGVGIGAVGIVATPPATLFCGSDSDCAGYATTKVCDLTTNTCVQCTGSEAGACTPAKPVCVADSCAAACASTSDCSNFVSDPYCESGTNYAADTGQCVQCNITGGTPSGATVDECGFATPVCSKDSCTGCTAPADCANRVDGRHTCSAGECDQCVVSGADPTCPATGPICNAGLCGGSCGSDSDCSARTDGNVHCDTSSGACVPCTTAKQAADCPATKPACVSDTCQGCSDSTACAGRTDGNLVCDTTKGACVQCTGSGTTSQCPDSAPVCGNDTCGGCTKNTDCSVRGDGNNFCVGGACVQCATANGFDAGCNTANPDKPICVSNVCTGCTAGTQCPTTASICNTSTGACSACTADPQCATEHPATPHCDTTGDAFNGQCVVCDTSSQCNAAAPICLGASDTCSATCTSNTQCAAYTPSHTVCDTNSGGGETLKGQCVGCLAAGSGNCPASAPTCPTATRQCSACGGDTDCASYTGTTHCDTNADSHAGQCVQCANTSQCGSGAPVCESNNTCGKCTSLADCTRFGTNIAFCNPSTGACVNCVSNVDCKSSAPVCTNNSCVSCAVDSDCSLYPATPACQLAGSSNAGQCGQCSRDNTSLCTGGTPACNYDSGKCQLCTVGGADLGGVATGCAGNHDGVACEGSGAAVFCGCDQDSDCGNATSGRICDQVSHLCANGCSRATGRNNCPSGQFCTSDDLTGQTSGICTMTCAFDVDCQSTMPTLPYCLGGVLQDGGATLPDGGTTSRCAGCRTDGDCSGTTTVCEPSAKVCVQCTAGNVSGCSAAAQGAICLDDETCGCAVDSDCGSATSGRICDRFTQKCTTGCYLVGGNGCPSGTVCSAAGAKAGSCVVPTDLGAASFDLASPPPDLSVPVDHALNRNSVTGGGLTCAMQGHGSPSSAWLLAAVGLWLASRRRRARVQPSRK